MFVSKSYISNVLTVRSLKRDQKSMSLSQSRTHTRTHALPTKSQAQNDLPSSIMLQMYLVTGFEMSEISAFQSVTTLLCSSCFDVEP